MYELSAPTAILLDSDCGWVNSGSPRAKVFKLPSFSLKSKDGIIYYYSPRLQRKYKGNPIKELEKFLKKGFISVGYISYQYSTFTSQGYKLRNEKYPLLNWRKENCNSYDACFHFYKEQEVETCPYEDFCDDVVALKHKNGNYLQGVSEHVSNFKKSDYIKSIEKARLYINSGDIYQVNLSQKYNTSCISNACQTLVKFYESQPVPFSGLIKFDDHTIISGSMELFIRKNGNRVITRPIKGTARRGGDRVSDEKIKEQLKNSKKEKAENLMIVDLMRNDFGRICETGSVKVNELFRVNKYKTLFQMESEVEGVLRRGTGLPEIIASTFPPGSVTGAPKSRAIEIICEIEPHHRGPYCGTFGVFYPDMNFTLSVAIRIMLLTAESTCYWVGSGIVWDSDPENEYEETLLKAQAIRSALM